MHSVNGHHRYSVRHSEPLRTICPTGGRLASPPPTRHMCQDKTTTSTVDTRGLRENPPQIGHYVSKKKKSKFFVCREDEEGARLFVSLSCVTLLSLGSVAPLDWSVSGHHSEGNRKSVRVLKLTT